MKALMFGWEFPPHILGGLGTASFGLTRGMAMQPDMDITFCIPKPWGDEDQSFLKIVGVNQVPIVWKDVDREYVQQRVSKAGMNADQYYKYRDHIYADFSYRHVTDLGCLEFSGRYPDNLLEEINNYSIVAGVIARTEEYDIIHAHDWLTYPAGIHAKNVSGKPLVIHVHATDYDRSRGNVNPDVYAIEKNGMDNADHIITVSNLTRQTVIEKYHQDPAKVTTVHNAVEPLSPEILAIPDKKGVKDKVITFLGRITMQKGPEYFVEAAAKVLAKAPYARFVMAGSGDMMDQMIRLAAARNISDRFHFYVARSLEQVKVDLAYSQNNVKILGVSGGVAYGALGATHHSLHDIAVLRTFPGMNIVLPCDARQTRKLVKLLVDYPEPVYVRVGRAAVPDVYENDDFDFILGKANMLLNGTDLTIIAAGETVYHAYQAGLMLQEKGIKARVLDMSSIKPVDAEAIRKAAEETGRIITVEEHSQFGGLGAIVVETLSENPVPVRIIGIPDENVVHGNSHEIFAHYGLDKEGICKAALEFMKK